MMRSALIKDSRFLSFILRHDPSAIGVELDDAGWIEVPRLLKALERHRPQITRERLIEIVETNDKKRFAFSEKQEKIRASQGHSISIDLKLSPVSPPSLLYHGTARQNVVSIRNQGLLRGQRHHVHLSSDETTAMKVGSRYGKPVVLKIEAERMNGSGFSFYVSENGVWLTEYVPPSFVMLPNDDSE
jgi:putative RNA 2'-phosphotransferase